MAVESPVVVSPVVKVRLRSDGVDVSMERVVESCDEISEFPLDSSQDELNTLTSFIIMIIIKAG
jgi:hypothetical protein